MHSLTSHLTLAAALSVACIAASPWNAHAAPPGQGVSVTVEGERILLGSLLPSLRGAASMLDLGASPAPGRRRIIGRREIQTRIREAHLISRKLALPRRFNVRRAQQVISSVRLSGLAKAALKSALPSGSQAKEVHVARGMTLPLGTVEIRLAGRYTWRDGSQLVPCNVWVAGTRYSKLSVVAHISHQGRPKLLIKRGERVRVVVRGTGLRIQSFGVAQQDARFADFISVLPIRGSRVIQAKVTGPGAVEVTP